MAKRLLSHLLILMAVFVLTATFFIWTVERRVLNSDTLSAELQKAGVTQELAALLPEIAAKSQEGDQATDAVIAVTQSKISEVISADYVHEKLEEISSSVLGYITGQSNTATLDISDFPQRLAAAGIDTGGEIDETFSEPINLNESGQLDNLAQAYKTFSALKYIGIVMFILLIGAEWYIAERGKKLQRISRVFLYSGLWYVLYWGLLVVVPSRLSPVLERQVADFDFGLAGFIDSVLRAVQGIFSGYFLGFAITCLVIAAFLYIIRYYKHGDVAKPIYATPTRSIRNK